MSVVYTTGRCGVTLKKKSKALVFEDKVAARAATFFPYKEGRIAAAFREIMHLKGF